MPYIFVLIDFGIGWGIDSFFGFGLEFEGFLLDFGGIGWDSWGVGFGI